MPYSWPEYLISSISTDEKQKCTHDLNIFRLRMFLDLRTSPFIRN